MSASALFAESDIGDCGLKLVSLFPAATLALSVDFGDCDAVVTVALGVGTAACSDGVSSSWDSDSSPSL